MAEGEGQLVGKATAKIVLDSRGAIQDARAVVAAGREMSRALANASKEVQAARRVELEQARQLTTQMRTQYAQTSAAARASHAQASAAARIAASQAQQAARATAQVQIQQSRAAAQVQIAQARAVAQAQIQQAKAAAQVQVQQARAASQASRTSSGSSLMGGLGGFVGGSIGRVAGALGIGLGVKELIDASVAADKVATSYRRQQVAAVSLVGSQRELNSLLAAYGRVTGGAVDDATALQQVINLQTQGFANSAAQLERFMRGARGASLATGRTVDDITQRAVLESANQTGMRLNEIGLAYDQVRQKAEQLRATNMSLSKEEAYREAIIVSLNEKYGALADSAEAQATGAEKAARSWANVNLEIGKLVGPGVDFAGSAISIWLDSEIEKARVWQRLLREGIQLAQNTNTGGGTSGRAITGAPAGSTATERTALRDDIARLEAQLLGLTRARSSIAEMPNTANTRAALADMDQKLRDVNAELSTLRGQLGNIALPTLTPSAAHSADNRGATVRGSQYNDEQRAAMVEWSERRAEIERQANRASINETRQYQSQRAATIRNYEKQIANESADYARQWAQRERDLMENIATIHRDSARQRVRWERDLAQSIAEAQRDSAERVGRLERDHGERIADYRADSAKRLAERQEEFDERIADAREDSLKRIAELEDNYARESQRRAAQYSLERKIAASNNDGRALWELDQRYKLENEQAKEAHDEELAKERERLADFEREQQEAHDKAIAKERENLAERIAEEEKAHRQRLSDEADALAKSISQQQTAHEQRLADQAEADNQRIEDMKTAFDKEKTQADTERGIRLQRLTDEHNDQLGEMDRQHGLRMTQIATNAAEERAALDEKFKADLHALGVHVDGYTAEIDRITNAAIANATRFLKGVSEAQELTSERSQIQQRLKTLVPGTSEWIELRHRLNTIDERLKELSNGGGVDSASVSVVGAATVPPSTWNVSSSGMQFAYPIAKTPAMAATGTGGGALTVIVAEGAIVINPAPGQSEERIGEIVRRELLAAVQDAAKAYQT